MKKQKFIKKMVIMTLVIMVCGCFEGCLGSKSPKEEQITIETEDIEVSGEQKEETEMSSFNAATTTDEQEVDDNREEATTKKSQKNDIKDERETTTSSKTTVKYELIQGDIPEKSTVQKEETSTSKNSIYDEKETEYTWEMTSGGTIYTTEQGHEVMIGKGNVEYVSTIKEEKSAAKIFEQGQIVLNDKRVYDTYIMGYEVTSTKRYRIRDEWKYQGDTVLIEATERYISPEAVEDRFSEMALAVCIEETEYGKQITVLSFDYYAYRYESECMQLIKELIPELYNYLEGSYVNIFSNNGYANEFYSYCYYLDKETSEEVGFNYIEATMRAGEDYIYFPAGTTFGNPFEKSEDLYNHKYDDTLYFQEGYEHLRTCIWLPGREYDYSPDGGYYNFDTGNKAGEIIRGVSTFFVDKDGKIYHNIEDYKYKHNMYGIVWQDFYGEVLDEELYYNEIKK